MDTKAAVAHAPGEHLSIETVRLEGPRSGEVLIEVMATVFATPMPSRFRVAILKASSPQSSVTKAQVWFERWARM